MQGGIQIKQSPCGSLDIDFAKGTHPFNVRRSDHIEAELLGNIIDDLRSDTWHLFRVRRDQCVLANGVNQARNAS